VRLSVEPEPACLVPVEVAAVESRSEFWVLIELLSEAFGLGLLEAGGPEPRPEGEDWAAVLLAGSSFVLSMVPTLVQKVKAPEIMGERNFITCRNSPDTPSHRVGWCSTEY
jgi:hypothetical protein